MMNTTERAKQEEKEIATVILEQLGGSNRIGAMIGANGFICGSMPQGTYLQFQFKGNRKYNVIRIVLNYQDTYDVHFMKMKKANYELGTSFELKIVDSINGVYNDMLKETIERQIGMYLSL